MLPGSESAPADTVPPPLPLMPDRKASSVRHPLVILLSLCLGLFVVEAIVSLVDESLILLLDVHVLTMIRMPLFLFAMLMAVVTYALMGLTPMIPKRLFLPLTLFNPVAGLIAIPLAVYFYDRIHEVALGISLCQVILGLGILYQVQGGLRFHWPLVIESQLAVGRFS